MRIILSFLLCSVIVFSACQSDTSEKAETTAAQEAAETNIDNIDNSQIQLVCKSITQAGDTNPHHEVYIKIGTNEAKVADIGPCQPISRDRFERFAIDSTAIMAVGGQSGDEEQYVYVIRTSTGRIIVREGYRLKTAAGERPAYQYKAVATFTDNELSTNPQLNKVQLVGTYVAEGGPNRSWVFFVGLSDLNLNAQLFQLSQALPEVDQIAGSLAGVNPTVIGILDVDMITLEFDSSLGKGRFELDGKQLTATFDDQSGPDGPPLVLSRIR
jgi:hypothetical protein